MSNHDQYEQLCALAAAGEISLSDRQALEAHIDACPSCRGVFADMEEIHAKWLPERPGFEVHTNPQSDLRLRAAILRRASKEGARFSRDAQVSSFEAWAFLPQTPRKWAFASAAVAVFCIMLAVTIWEFRQRPVMVQTPEVETATRPANAVSESAHAKTPSADSSAGQIALERAIEASQAEQTRLRQQLEEQKHMAAAAEQGSKDAAHQLADLGQQLEAARASQRQAEAELANLRSSHATTDAITIAQQQEIQRLTDHLTEQTASLGRERQLLSAGREIRDLIAARNLRIIDVYDTDGKGKTSRAFGRVFYTEGKSLVFYAYDLNERKPDSGTYAFFVWGKRDGAPQDIKSLGTLAKDDHVQKRWVFTTTDSKVLGEIDSVFVTLETADKPGKHPSGKRVLSAFLHTPVNHP